MHPTDHVCALFPLPMQHLPFEKVDALLMHSDTVDILCYYSYRSGMM